MVRVKFGKTLKCVVTALGICTFVASIHAAAMDPALAWQAQSGRAMSHGESTVEPKVHAAVQVAEKTHMRRSVAKSVQKNHGTCGAAVVRSVMQEVCKLDANATFTYQACTEGHDDLLVIAHNPRVSSASIKECVYAAPRKHWRLELYTEQPATTGRTVFVFKPVSYLMHHGCGQVRRSEQRSGKRLGVDKHGKVPCFSASYGYQYLSGSNTAQKSHGSSMRRQLSWRGNYRLDLPDVV